MMARTQAHLNSVISPTQRKSDESAVKSRSNKSPAGAVSRLPLRHFLRLCAPTKPISAMIRSTRLRDTRVPLRRSCPHTLGAPYVQRELR